MGTVGGGGAEPPQARAHTLHTLLPPQVVERVRLKATTFGQEVAAPGGGSGSGTSVQYKVDPDVVARLYERWVMPLTKEVEVQYLLARLEGEGGVLAPAEVVSCRGGWLPRGCLRSSAAPFPPCLWHEPAPTACLSHPNCSSYARQTRRRCGRMTRRSCRQTMPASGKRSCTSRHGLSPCECQQK